MPGVFAMSMGRTQLPLGGGTLCLAPPWVRLHAVARTGRHGHATCDLDFEAPLIGGSVVAGSTWYFQFWYHDAGAGGVNLSNAITLTLQ